jgi:hypothetical protein
MAIGGKMTPRVIEERNKEALALQMRLAGRSYQAIANALGYADHSGAYRAVERALVRVTAEPADELRKIELERLDQLYRWTMEEATTDHLHFYQGVPTGFLDSAPRLKAMELALRIMERRSKLLGLDAPARQRIEVLSEDVVDAEIKRLTAEMEQANSQAEV